MMVVKSAQEKHMTNLLQTSVNSELNCSQPQAGARSPKLRILPRVGKHRPTNTGRGSNHNIETFPIAGREIDSDCDIATVCIFQGGGSIAQPLDIASCQKIAITSQPRRGFEPSVPREYQLHNAHPDISRLINPLPAELFFYQLEVLRLNFGKS